MYILIIVSIILCVLCFYTDNFVKKLEVKTKKLKKENEILKNANKLLENEYFGFVENMKKELENKIKL